jgi:hypothetical protein
MSEKIKAILSSEGWENYQPLPSPAPVDAYLQIFGCENLMRETLNNGGSLYRKKINTKAKDPFEKGRTYDISFAIIVAVEVGICDREFMVFLESPTFCGTDTRCIYSHTSLEYVEKNLDKILTEIVKPDFYVETNTTQRRYNSGLTCTSAPSINYPTIDPLEAINLN